MSDDSVSPPKAKETPLLLSFVSKRIYDLQRRYLSTIERPAAASTLAALRHAAGNPVGTDPNIWLFEFADFPENLQGREGHPSTAEKAVHLAFTLYAIHQQSQLNGMYQSGPEHSLGRAIAQLDRQQRNAGTTDPIGKLPSRFAALGTATDFDEISHYARQLITQLRGAGIPLDYGRLAIQFDRLQNPAQAGGVRLAWGREFAGFRDDDTTSTTKQKEK